MKGKGKKTSHYIIHRKLSGYSPTRKEVQDERFKRNRVCLWFERKGGCLEEIRGGRITVFVVI